MKLKFGLLNANASFGNSSYGVPPFPTLRDVLAHMDRFGVARSVVWNIESRDSNCPWSNYRLLDQLARTPGASDRLIPALSVSPTMIYENRAVADLKKAMKQRGIRALRFTRGMSNFTLAQIEPIIRELRPLRPVLFLSNTETDGRDILDFTRSFPGVPVVLGEAGWSHCNFIFDLMRQRKNVYVETSSLHVWGDLEMIAKRFGVSRILFGIGAKPHNGAAIAALARANFSEADRERIAHGNLERLLGLKPVKAAPLPAINSLWSEFLAGRALAAEVVDAHIHMGPSGGYIVECQAIDDQIQPALEQMNKIGISTMIASGMHALFGDPVEGNRLLEDKLAGHGGRFAGYFAFNPYYEKAILPVLDEFFARDFFVGFKVLCDYWRVPLTDPRFNGLWQFAHRHRLPILIHTWSGPYDSPAMLKDIARKYPNAFFLLAHSGGVDDGRREAVELARHNKNVFLEWCGSFHTTIPWEETIAQIGPERVVFGTDAVMHNIAWELGRLLSLDVPESKLIPILGRNMRNILAQRR